MSCNVICICLDTFRADLVYPEDRLSQEARTPNLDRFLQDSVYFRQAYGEGMPTLQMRRGYFTGMRSFPWRFNFDRRGHWHHAYGWHKIPPEQDTLAEILLRYGYVTGLVTDTYHMFKPTMNFTRGYVSCDLIRGQETDNWKCGPYALIEKQIRKHVRHAAEGEHPGLMQYLHNQRGRKSEEDYSCARVFRSAMEWIEDNADNSPFFLWIDSFDPHEPWDPPASYVNQYYSDYDGLDFISPRMVFHGQAPTEEELQRTRALYLGEVTMVDHWLGEFLDRLKALHLYDSTLIFIGSDHGTEILDKGGFGKSPRNLHAFNTRLMWMLRHPEGPRGLAVDGFVQNHDFAPTILSLLEIPACMEGRNVWPLVDNDPAVARDHVVIGWAGFRPGESRVSVRDQAWNAILPVEDIDDPPRLYALRSDIDEEMDVARDHPEVLARQRKRLEAVLGGTLPFSFLECVDPAPAPCVACEKARDRRKRTM